MASAARNASARARRRFAESSSVRSSHCVACVQLPFSAVVRIQRAEGVHPLALHRVPLVGHRRRADLLRPERLLDLLHVLEEPQVVGELRGGLRRGPRARRGPGRPACACRSGPRSRRRLGKPAFSATLRSRRSAFSASPSKSATKEACVPGRPLARRGTGARRRAATSSCEVEDEVLEPEAGALADRRRLGRLEVGVADAGDVLLLAREARRAAATTRTARRLERARARRAGR